jgi:hypothetical protein
MEVVGKVLLGVGLNYGVHCISMALHNWACMPHTMTDIVKGLVVTASPVCSTLISVGQTTQNAYAALITGILASTIINKVNSPTS